MQHTEPCFSWLNPGQIDIHSEAFGPLQPAVVGILNIQYAKKKQSVRKKNIYISRM